MATFAAARNLSHDPRPSSNTRFTAAGGATATYVTDRSYSGAGSVLLSIPTAGSVVWTAAANDDADIAALVGGTIRAMVHASGASGSGVQAKMRLTYTDATNIDTAVSNLSNSGLDFERTIFPDLANNPAKTLRNISIVFTNTNVNTRTIYVGGFDTRRNQALDGFISGSSGVGYSWEGAANNSPSNRAAITQNAIIGSGGSIYPSIKVHVVTRQNQVVREITDHFIDGSVTYDLDAEGYKGSCNIILDDPHLIHALSDEYVRITLHIDQADGTFKESSLGMFTVEPPKETWLSGANDQWSYTGKDMLALLETWMLTSPASGGPETQATYFPSNPDGTAWIGVFTSSEYVPASGYFAGPGVPYQTILDDLLHDRVGLAKTQYAIPISGSVGPQGIGWPNNENVGVALRDLCQAAGLKKPWVTPQGVITSAPAKLDPATQMPSVTFTTGEDSPVRWPFEVESDTSGVGNRIRVTSTFQVNTTVQGEYHPAVPAVTDPDWEPMPVKGNKKKKKKAKAYNAAGAPIVTPAVADYYDQVPYTYWGPVEAYAQNNDPAHPLSTVRLGRIIDLPDVSIPMMGGLTGSNASAAAHASNLLREVSKIPVTVRLTTEVMVRGLNEVYELNLLDSDGNPIPSGQGKYDCRGWNMQLGSPWQMTHTLRRIVEYKDLAWVF